MKKIFLLALVLVSCAWGQASSQWLLTVELASGVDLTKLTPEQAAVFAAHAKHLASLFGKGAVLIGRTNAIQDPLGIIVLECDEATARAIAADDPATRAGYLKTVVHPFGIVKPPAQTSLVTDTEANYETVAKFLLEGARKMPEESYAFRPTPDVRTFAQLVGHIAEAQYIACSLTRGEEYKPRNIEQTLSKKSDLVPVLESAIGFCRESWSQLTPAALADPVTLFGQKRTKLGALDLATAHAFEHYGNMVTYLRLKGLVPPSSEK